MSDKEVFLNKFQSILTELETSQIDVDIKEKLKELRKVTGEYEAQANLRVVEQEYCALNLKPVLSLLELEFSSFEWEVIKKRTGHNDSLIVTWKGELLGVFIELDYYSYYDTFGIDLYFYYKDEWGWSTADFGKERYESYPEAIARIKEILIPLQQAFSQLQIK